MPGIVGFTCSRYAGAERSDAFQLLKKQCELLTHKEDYLQDSLDVDDKVAGSRVSVGIVNPVAQPSCFNGLKVWMEGEILNRDALIGGSTMDGCESDAGLIAKLARLDPSFRFLRQLDGVFAAVIYDEPNSKLHFITDRHGLEFLYYTHDGDDLVWSSEVKGFLASERFQRCIDEKSLEDFFRHGHLVDNETWLRDAKLFPPAAHWVWDLDRHEFSGKNSYWSWEELTPYAASTDFMSLAEESARLFRDAVSRCDHRPSQRVGVLLSGGLDSRVILASMEDRSDPITAVTFGSANSSDVRIAAQVAAVKRAKHVLCEINEENWLVNRENYVWWLDGHLDLMHMHYGTCAPEIRDLFDVNLSGFLGDATIGGSYLTASGAAETEKIVNRGRRLIAHGIQQGKIFSHERLPFFNNDFLCHAMRVPAAMRKNSRFYFSMLRFLLPKAYHSIPWQSSGLSIRYPAPLHVFAKSRARAMGWGRRVVGLGERRDGYFDYNRWLASRTGRAIVDKFLSSTEARYLELETFSRRKELRRVCMQPAWTSRETEFVCRGLTLEIWLRQLEIRHRVQETQR